MCVHGDRCLRTVWFIGDEGFRKVYSRRITSGSGERGAGEGGEGGRMMAGGSGETADRGALRGSSCILHVYTCDAAACVWEQVTVNRIEQTSDFFPRKIQTVHLRVYIGSSRYILLLLLLWLFFGVSDNIINDMYNMYETDFMS